MFSPVAMQPNTAISGQSPVSGFEFKVVAVGDLCRYAARCGRGQFSTLLVKNREFFGVIAGCAIASKREKFGISKLSSGGFNPLESVGREILNRSHCDTTGCLVSRVWHLKTRLRRCRLHHRHFDGPAIGQFPLPLGYRRWGGKQGAGS